MGQPSAVLAFIREINDKMPFNRWCGVEIVSAEPGAVTVAMPWRAETAQYSGFLHAGVVGMLIETSCGFAAVSLSGRVLASHYSVNCLRPAVGERFIARARIVKPGKTQVFAACELYAEHRGTEKLVATGETLLVVAAAAEG